MADEKKSLVWDLPVRLFHWSIVILVVFSWYSIEIEENLDWHFISGYCVLALLLFRVTWGFIGTRYARFRSMLFKPATTLQYFRSLFSGQNQRYSGHNPAGSLSVFALLGLMLVQATTGLFANDEDYYFGPLSDYVSIQTADRLTELHHLNFNILTGFIVLHILAIIFYRLVKKEKLLLAMITGNKSTPESSGEGIAHSKLVAALLTLIVSASAVYLLVNFA